MENKFLRENISVASTLYDGVGEQSVELDCILPDYCPEIFKVHNLTLCPCITKSSIEGTRLSYEMAVSINLLYSGEEGEIFSLKQNLDYARSVELPYSPKNPFICLSPEVDSKSCRVINKRRVDIRGVIRVVTKVTADDVKSVISGGTGDGLQLKKEQLLYPVKRISKAKALTVTEELKLPENAADSVLKCSAAVVSCEKKVLTGKLLTKGEVQVNCLYSVENDSVPKELCEALPFSQILDIEGLDERFELCVGAVVKCVNISCEGGKLTASIDIEVKCLALRYESCELATDAFSTKYEATPAYCEVNVAGIPTCISEGHKQKLTLTYSDGDIEEIYYAGGCVKSIGFTDGIIKGALDTYIFAKNEGGKIVYLEGSVPFEHKIGTAGEAVWVSGAVVGVSYNLLTANGVEVTADIKLGGCILPEKKVKLIEDIRFDYSKENAVSEYALKLYFPIDGETAWDIAKRCKTSPDGIIRENGLDSGTVSGGKMLLIPYIN